MRFCDFKPWFKNSQKMVFFQMKIGLIGYGKMGRAVERAAREKGHDIIGCLRRKDRDFSLLKEADVWIDFTVSEAVWDTIQACAFFKKNLVIGTTGWETHLTKASQLAHEIPFGLLAASNFSIGVYLLKRILQNGAELFKSFDYDVAGIEMHHSQKIDAPSGTARELSQLLSESLGREVPFSSVRCGSLMGTHGVIFNSPDDTIEITHRASGRMGFARGAIASAEWLNGKVGYYTFDDFIRSFLERQNAAKWSDHIINHPF